MASASISVLGTPVPQGSKTPIMINGKPRLIEGKGKGAAAHKKWRKTVREAAETWALQNRHVVWDIPCAISISFFMPRPTKPKFSEFPATRPDLDKLVRSILDSLCGTEGPILKEDGRFVKITAEKHFAEGREPGVEIEIETLIEPQDTLF